MDKIKLFDSTTLEIEDGASLGHIVHKAKSAAAARKAAEAFTDANLTHVEFLHDGRVNGIYDNLGLIQYEAPTVSEPVEGEEEEAAADPVEPKENPEIDGRTVTIALYQK